VLLIGRSWLVVSGIVTDDDAKVKGWRCQTIAAPGFDERYVADLPHLTQAWTTLLSIMLVVNDYKLRSRDQKHPMRHFIRCIYRVATEPQTATRFCFWFFLIFFCFCTVR